MTISDTSFGGPFTLEMPDGYVRSFDAPRNGTDHFQIVSEEKGYFLLHVIRIGRSFYEVFREKLPDGTRIMNGYGTERGECSRTLWEQTLDRMAHEDYVESMLAMC